MIDNARTYRILWRLLFAAALIAVVFLTEARAAACPCAASPCMHAATASSSWIFAPSRYSHDPDTGVRVAQYARKPPVEPLADQRLVTSGYRRTRTVLRGPDGSADTYYRVENFGNGRGQMDAEWERYHDAWRGSTVAGGNTFGGFGGSPGFYGPGYGGYGGAGFGGSVFPPGFGFPPGFDSGRYNGGPDSRRLDPDAADGYPDGVRRTPDRRFFRYGTPNGEGK